MRNFTPGFAESAEAGGQQGGGISFGLKFTRRRGFGGWDRDDCVRPRRFYRTFGSGNKKPSGRGRRVEEERTYLGAFTKSTEGEEAGGAQSE